jgi:hypothetical protein
MAMPVLQDPGYAIPTGMLGPDWKAGYVAWMKCLVVPSQTAIGGFTINYDHEYSALYAFPAGDITTIAQFVMAPRLGQDLTPWLKDWHFGPPDDPVEPVNPDETFRLNRNCYVVLELIEPEWSFSTGHCGVTMRSNQRGWYDSLCAVPPNSGPVLVDPDNGIQSPGCKMIYFSARVRKHLSLQNGFNVFVVNENSPNVAVPVDPDIKNDGGPPNWPS